MNRRLLHVMFN